MNKLIIRKRQKEKESKSKRVKKKLAKQLTIYGLPCALTALSLRYALPVYGGYANGGEGDKEKTPLI